MDGVYVAFSALLMVYLIVDHGASRWREDVAAGVVAEPAEEELAEVVELKVSE